MAARIAKALPAATQNAPPRSYFDSFADHLYLEDRLARAFTREADETVVAVGQERQEALVVVLPGRGRRVAV
jgi:phosphoribosyl-ATP pyrophosphohydrolase